MINRKHNLIHRDFLPLHIFKNLSTYIMKTLINEIILEHSEVYILTTFS